jgi:hypothetical protein
MMEIAAGLAIGGVVFVAVCILRDSVAASRESTKQILDGLQKPTWISSHEDEGDGE